MNRCRGGECVRRGEEGRKEIYIINTLPPMTSFYINKRREKPSICSSRPKSICSLVRREERRGRGEVSNEGRRRRD